MLLAGTQVGASTDAEGRYMLVLPADRALPEAARIQFMSIGLTTAEWPLPSQGDGPLQHDALLRINPNSSLSVFWVRQPTLLERVKWTLKRWFSRREE